MSAQKYSENTLREMHGDEVDIVGHHMDTHHSFEIHENSINVVGDPKKKKLEKLGKFGWDEVRRALLIEFIACVLMELLGNYSPSLAADIIGTYIQLNMLYPVSGSNMNACISLALWYYEEEFVIEHIVRRFGYMLVIQPFGLFVGQMLSWGVIGPNLAYLKPADTAPIKIAFCEFFWTGALIFVALHTIVSRYVRPTNQLGINFVFFATMVYFVSKAGANISGASYNPSKYLINQAVAYHREVEPNAFQNWYCYVFPPFLGAIAFTLCFKYFFEPTYYRFMSMKLKWESKFFAPKYE